MIQGLYQKIAQTRATMESRMRDAADKTLHPMDSQHAGMLADISRKDLAEMEGQVLDNAAMVAELNDMIARLENPSFCSADRTRALCYLEDAQSRLLRELGDKPSASTMAHYINEGATLILDGHKSRISIQVTGDNSALCDVIFHALESN